MGKQIIIHHYTKKHAFGKSHCGVDYHKLKDSSHIIKWVTCKKCLKINKADYQTVTK